MKKSDLKDGMVVEIRGIKYLTIGYFFINNDGFMDMRKYTEDLIHIHDNDWSINKVYSKCQGWGHGFKKGLENHKDIIWERKAEPDWNKVKRGTKVRVWDYKGDDVLEREFYLYDESLCHPFITLNTEKMKLGDFKYCELVEERI